MEKFYWVGFEDGFADNVEDVRGMTARQAFAYRKGFRAGLRAWLEATEQGISL